MARFVLLQHDDSRGSHWDFMLESGEALATWALSRPADAAGPIDARRLADHRLAYLDYEGPVSGDRGTVARCDEGTFSPVSQSDDAWSVRLAGRRLRGVVTLLRLTIAPDLWSFRFEPEASPPVA